MDKDFNVTCLDSMKRDRLQKLCKKLKLKANGKNTELIASLKLYYKNHFTDGNSVSLETTCPASVNSKPNRKPQTRTSIGNGRNSNNPAVQQARTRTRTTSDVSSLPRDVRSRSHSSRNRSSSISKRTANVQPRLSSPPCNQTVETVDKKVSEQYPGSQPEVRTLKRERPSDVISPAPPAKLSRCDGEESCTRRKTYSVSPKHNSDEKLKTAIMDELERRIVQKYGSKPTDCSQSRIPRLAVFTIGKSVDKKSQVKFDQMHRKTFSRMESIDDYMNRKEERKKKLMTPTATRIPTSLNKTSTGKQFTLSTCKLSTFAFSAQDRKSTSGTPLSQSSSAFNFSAVASQTPKKAQFDLKASLSKQLPYKPHSGKLKDTYLQSRQENRSKAPMKRNNIKAHPATQIRGETRLQQKKHQKTRRDENMFKRRQLDV